MSINLHFYLILPNPDRVQNLSQILFLEALFSALRTANTRWEADLENRVDQRAVQTSIYGFLPLVTPCIMLMENDFFLLSNFGYIQFFDLKDKTIFYWED